MSFNHRPEIPQWFMDEMNTLKVPSSLLPELENAKFMVKRIHTALGLAFSPVDIRLFELRKNLSVPGLCYCAGERKTRGEWEELFPNSFSMFDSEWFIDLNPAVKRRCQHELYAMNISCTVLYCRYHMGVRDIERLVGIRHSTVYHHINSTIAYADVGFVHRNGDRGKIYLETIKQLANDI